MIRKSLGELAALIEGEVVGDPATEISGAADIEDAHDGDIVFAESPRHLQLALQSSAAAVIAGIDAADSPKPLIRTSNPRLAFARVLGSLMPRPEHPAGIHPTSTVGANLQAGEGVFIGFSAYVGSGVTLGNDVWIHPLAYIGDNVCIGSGSIVHPSVVILDNVTIGNNVIIHAGSVIGADGFGYTPFGKEHFKIPQIGSVVIHDHVEIGANVTIDRARTGVTSIGRGTKIDNLVHIAHNVTIGENCIIVAQVGISGSVHIGDGVMFGGQAGAKDHVDIGSGSIVCARSGIMGSLAPGSYVSGYPAGPHREQMRAHAALLRLPELLKTIRSLEKRIADLEEDAG